MSELELFPVPQWGETPVQKQPLPWKQLGARAGRAAAALVGMEREESVCVYNYIHVLIM